MSTTIKLKGIPYSIKGDLPMPGSEAPDITFVKKDLSEANLLDDFQGKVKVLIAVSSLDTRVCQTETRKFNEALSQRDGAVGIIISKDLPFAMNRFCEAEGIHNVVIGSDFRYGDFGTEFGTEIIAGPFKGLSARAVFVVDSNNVIRYTELVPEIDVEPQYDNVLAAVDKLLK